MKVGKKSVFFALFFVCLGSSSQAENTQELIRMPRSLGMGGIGIGLADDEYALFQNPAGLAGNTDSEFKLAGLNFEVSAETLTTALGSASVLGNFSISSLDQLMGKQIYFRGGGTPIARIGKFTFAYVLDSQFSFHQTNASNPVFNLTAMTTHGFNFGYGFSLSRGRRPIDDIRIGLGAKVLWRRGGSYKLSTAQVLQASEQGLDYITNLMGPFSMGIGLDTGIQYVYKTGRNSRFSVGASFTDLTWTRFNLPSAQDIEPALGAGIGYRQEYDSFQYSVGLDFRNLLQSTGFSNKVHFGGEAKLAIWSVYFGFNQLYLSFGAALDIWITKISLVTYGEENGYFFNQNPSRRYLLQVDVKLPI